MTRVGFVEQAFKRVRVMINELKFSVKINTTNRLFDDAVRQMRFDNSIRGGTKVILCDIDDTAKYSNYDNDERVKNFMFFRELILIWSVVKTLFLL